MNTWEPRRRDVLRLGALTALGVTAGLRRSLAGMVRAKSCILIWLDGGPSHLETFDPKPDAPTEVRGPFGSIATTVPGISLADCLPETAGRLDRIALVRSVTSPLGEHNLGSHYVLTGVPPMNGPAFPSYGAVSARLRGGAGDLPNHVAIPDHNPMAGPGFLPSEYGPFDVGGDPARPDFRARDLELYPGMTAIRLERRRAFLLALEHSQRSTGSLDPESEQAFRLTTAPATKQAFDLASEQEAVRDRYGRKTLGQSCLLARRLVERGVPFVTVTNRGWDTHDSLVTRLKEGYAGAKVGVGLVPTFDQAFSALLDDLAARGLLDETLVLVLGEFGRTPKLNTQGGRDHWPRVFSVALAGGGVRGGQVVGSSDRRGESPKDRPVTPADLARTIYTLLGVDPEADLTTPDGRKVKVNRDGQVISELLA